MGTHDPTAFSEIMRVPHIARAVFKVKILRFYFPESWLVPWIFPLFRQSNHQVPCNE